MVLTNSSASMARKDNFGSNSTSSVLRNSNGRRLRSRTNITPSAVIASQEAARNPRRRTCAHSQAPSHALRFAVEDTDSAPEMADKKPGSGLKRPQKNVQLPRCLRRAPFVETSPAALEAVDPDLKGVALEFVLDGLKVMGPLLYTIASTSKTDMPGERLPRELDVVINNISSDAPTHLLAVHSKPTTRVSLYPVHSIVLAAHCARLPPFPHSESRTPAQVGGKITLPVTPFCIPNPETFSIVLCYLYTKRVDRLFTCLLPIPLQGAKPSVDQLSRRYASTFTVRALLSHAAKVHGLWSNVVALGIFDSRLWQVIEVAWEVLLSALAVSTGASWETVSTAPPL